MTATERYIVLLSATVVAYFAVSKHLFDKLNDTIPIVVDELFHITQGMSFCRRVFTWDPKITTLPGLYLVSAFFLGSYFECSPYNLRFINLLASALNLILFSSILKYVYGNTNLSSTVLQALNLAVLPPLYFFSHVYYTDTLSLTFMLIYFRLCFINRHIFTILLFGALSVLMRQTNIVWIAMVLGHKIIELFIKSSRVFGNKYLNNLKLNATSTVGKEYDNSKLQRYYGFNDLYIALKYHITSKGRTLFKSISLRDVLVISAHLILLLSFLVFVYVNGSIVLGDKTAHKATIHLPQLFYFLLFYGFFGLPYVLVMLPATIKLLLNNKFKVLLLFVLFAIIVHYNTIIHPYLLADNRHYTFYIWNRWYGRHEYARYTSIPVYIVLLFNLYANLRDQNCISFLLPFCVSLFLVLGLQQMIEVRYFLIPYIILRLRFIKPSFSMVFTEFAWYMTMNVITFQVFFHKEIIWKDFEYAQRIIW